jgi:hypothetical protein
VLLEAEDFGVGLVLLDDNDDVVGSRQRSARRGGTRGEQRAGFERLAKRGRDCGHDVHLGPNFTGTESAEMLTAVE